MLHPSDTLLVEREHIKKISICRFHTQSIRQYYSGHKKGHHHTLEAVGDFHQEHKQSDPTA